MLDRISLAIVRSNALTQFCSTEYLANMRSIKVELIAPQQVIHTIEQCRSNHILSKISLSIIISGHESIKNAE